MVVLIASESASLARIASKQLAGFAINVLSKPPQARDLPGDAACVVFMIGDSRGVWFDALKRIRTESSALPTVVVTNENAETVRVLNKLGVRDVLWFSEISRLADHVADISTRWKLEGLIQKNLQSDLPPSV